MSRTFQANILILYQTNVWKFITLQMHVKNIGRNSFSLVKQASFYIPALPDRASHRVTFLLVRTSADAVRSKLRAQQRKSRINGTTKLFRQNSRIRFKNFRLSVIFNLHLKRSYKCKVRKLQSDKELHSAQFNCKNLLIGWTCNVTSVTFIFQFLRYLDCKDVNLGPT